MAAPVKTERSTLIVCGPSPDGEMARSAPVWQVGNNRPNR